MTTPPDAAPFDLETFLPYLLNQVAEAVSKRFQPCYHQDFGLTRTQWRVLAHLAAQDGLTARDIGRRIHEDKVSISRGVAALVAAGLLAKLRGQHDRRSDTLHLTSQGQALFRRLAQRAQAFEQDIALTVGADNMAELRRLLSLLRPVPGGRPPEAQV